jgi:hypothetical protein
VTDVKIARELSRMRGKSSRTVFGPSRHGAVWLALLAIALRALVPAGWIPGDLSQGIPFVICTTDGLVTFPFDIDGRPPPKHDGKSAGDSGCVFAAAAPLAMPARAALPTPPSSVAHAGSLPEEQAVASLLTFDRPLVRGPPLFS